MHAVVALKYLMITFSAGFIADRFLSGRNRPLREVILIALLFAFCFALFSPRMRNGEKAAGSETLNSLLQAGGCSLFRGGRHDSRASAEGRSGAGGARVHRDDLSNGLHALG